LFLVSFAILVFSAVASANTCTEAFFNTQSPTMFNQHSNIRVDSINTNNQSGSWKGKKYIYNNGIIEKVRADFKDEDHAPAYWIFYRDTNETVLKKEGYEYIISEDKKEDTLLYNVRTYYKGEYEYTQIIRIASNYLSEEITDSTSSELHEMYFKNDSIIEIGTENYNTDSSRTKQRFYVGDLNDDYKCEEYDEEGNLLISLLYIPNENGYSLKQSKGDEYIEAYVMSVEQNTTTIRKTHKPVKIVPKARYFDLLGRYKFTK
jgi:hypothetical protein